MRMVLEGKIVFITDATSGNEFTSTTHRIAVKTARAN